MRPGQNKRMRGRPNNNGGGNRKGPNPLTRSYESNGPDVKIRGNAHHVAEKYLQLARDAQSSGDPVAAESYLQHAEHYFRLIASAQAAQAGFNRQPDAVDDVDDGDEDALPDRFASPQPAAPFVPQQQPASLQPYGEQRQPYQNGSGGGGQPYGERPANGERPQFNDRNNYQRQDRNGQNGQRRPFDDRGGQGGQDRPFNDRPYGDRQSRRERFAQERADRQQRNGERPFGEGYQNRDAANGYGHRDAGSYRDPQAGEQPRDPYAGEQPRIEPAAEAQPAYAPEPARQPEPVRPSEVDAAAEPAQVAAEPAQAPRAEPAAPRRRERPAPAVEEAPGLPSFITTPTRAAPAPAERASAEPAAAEPALTTATAFPGDDAEEAPKFPRRRRRTARSAASVDAGEAPAAAAPPPVPGD